MENLCRFHGMSSGTFLSIGFSYVLELPYRSRRAIWTGSAPVLNFQSLFVVCFADVNILSIAEAYRFLLFIHQ